MDNNIITKIQFRQDTSTNWEAANPTLAIGEPAYVIDTKSFKIGDGNSHFKDLPTLSAESIIVEPIDNGKLYGRVRNIGAEGGFWEEIIIPEVDTRKNFNDILQANYDEVIDMNFTINVNGNTKKVFGVKKRVGNINLRAVNTVSDNIIAGMDHVYSIIDVRGTFDCGHNYVYQLNNTNLECNTFTYLKDNAFHIVANLVDTSRQIDNGVAELYIMFTRTDDVEVNDNGQE